MFVDWFKNVSAMFVYVYEIYDTWCFDVMAFVFSHSIFLVLQLFCI